MSSSGMLRRVVLLRTDVSEERRLLQETRRNIPEHDFLHSHRCENLT
jgi:hypothetical protein